MSKSYKKTSKVNKKKKHSVPSEENDVVLHNSSSRHPIISLPEVQIQHIHQTYRRFVNNGTAVNATLTIRHLLDQFMFATTGILLYPYVRAVRLKKVRILSPVTSQGTSVVLSINPIGIDNSQNNFNTVPEVYLDTSASIDVPAYLSLSPSRESPLGSWHYNTNIDNNLASIACPAGSTMDILFEYILNASNFTPSYTRAVVGAIAGNMYSGTILTSFVPVGVNNL